MESGEEAYFDRMERVGLLQQVLRVLARDSHHKGEPEMGALFDLIDYVLDDDERMISIVDPLVEKLDPRLVYAAQLIFRGFQYNAMMSHPNYPEEHHRSEIWSVSVDRTLTPGTPEALAFAENIKLGILSNRADRGKLLLAVGMLHDKTNPQVMEIGCSLGQILKKAATYNQKGGLPYSYTRVMQRSPSLNIHRPDGTPTKPTYEDEERGFKLYRMVRSGAFILGYPSIGLDLHDPTENPLIYPWAHNNSFTPAERRNDKGEINEFNKLNRKRPRGLHFIKADFVKFDHEAFINRFKDQLGAEGKLDIIYFPTMLYQLSEEERKIALVNAFERVKDDGLIIVQDYIKGVDKDGSLAFYEDMRPDYSYSVWVWNVQRPELEWQRYFTVEGGRVKHLIIEEAATKAPMAKKFGLTNNPKEG